MSNTESTEAAESSETPGFYALKKPFVSRQKGKDVEYNELPLPDVVTVGMMRKIKTSTSLLFAHELTELCAGLGPFEANKLHTADALGYVSSIDALLEPRPVASFEIPAISAFKPLLMKVTVDPTRQIEFVAQVLQISGMKRADIDAMDYRDFIPAVPLVLEMFPDPKN